MPDQASPLRLDVETLQRTPPPGPPSPAHRVVCYTSSRAVFAKVRRFILTEGLPDLHRSSRRIPFLHLLPPLLTCTHALHSPTLTTRLVKALLPLLTTLLSSKSDVQQQLQDASVTTSKKGKTRARGYEGDEVFKVGRGVLCSTREDGEVVEATLDGGKF